MLIALIYHDTNPVIGKICRTCVVWLNMYIVERITKYYQDIESLEQINNATGEKTTMRGIPYPDDWKTAVPYIKYVYSVMQFIATASILANDNQYMLLMTAFPVQIAAFLMTCVKKSIINVKTWHVLYMLSFCVAFTSVESASDLFRDLMVGVLLYAMRIRIGKYPMWLIVSGLMFFI